MKARPFDRVVVDAEVADLQFARSFLAHLPVAVPVEVREGSVPLPRGRRTVHLTRGLGSFLKSCPCSPGMVHCGYSVLTPAMQCPYACSYCFLRFYAPEMPLTLYANLEDAEREFLDKTENLKARVRMGTGEFADSLALDPWSEHSRWVRRLVERRPRVDLELKTKSDNVDLLLADGPLLNLLVAWSLNPEGTVRSEELGAATLSERLDAAERVVAAGFRVAFHFDPILLDDGWEEAYTALVRQLFERVAGGRVAWISLGTLRFPSRFLERWGRSLRGKESFFGEFLPGEDGKLRYFWPLRRTAYRRLAAAIRRWGGAGIPVYLCMESSPMWRSGMGWEPREGQVEQLLCGGQDGP